MKLSEKDFRILRLAGLISSDEIAVKEEDLILAVNQKTQTKRVIETTGIILEANKQILHD